LQTIALLKESCLPALENWDNLKREEKRVVLQAFAQRIEATPIDDNGLRLVIYWRDESQDEILLASRYQNGQRSSRDWLHSEIEQLIALVDNGASQAEIAAAFPDRNWRSIRYRIWKMRGKGAVEHIDPKPINDNETYGKYLERISDTSIKQAGSGDRWTKEEECLLLDLVDSGAPQVQLAEAFPNRRWWRIRWKITCLRGKGVIVPEVGKIKRNETITDYRQRTGLDTGSESTVAVNSMGFIPGYPGGSHARAR
jgi:hypothetical protein